MNGIFSFVSKYRGPVFVSARAVRVVCVAASEHDGQTAVFVGDDAEPFYSAEPVEEIAKRWQLSLARSIKISA